MGKDRPWLRIIMVIPLVALVFGAGYFAGFTHSTILAQGQDTQPASTVKLFSPFWESWNLVHERYVDPIDDEKLMEGAATGMVAALGDQHTEYMNPQLFTEVNTELSGNFEGIGASIRKDPTTGGIMIVSIFMDSPAQKGGLKNGDIIMKVDGQDITGLNADQVGGKVRGQSGTQVKLSLLRKGEKKLIDIVLTRAKIAIPIITSAVYQGNIGYIRLEEFSDTASAGLRKALTDMNADHLNGLIFDLRDNPGGGLQTAIDVASDFIKKGPITIERGKPGTPDHLLQASGKTVAPDVPMVVLINGGSASASELVSGALQDYKRAVLVGEQSYGKGSVQVWTGLAAGGGVKVTIAHFYTPYGRTIHEIGLHPDIVVPWDIDTSPNYDPQFAEAVMILRGEL